MNPRIAVSKEGASETLRLREHAIPQQRDGPDTTIRPGSKSGADAHAGLPGNLGDPQLSPQGGVLSGEGNGARRDGVEEVLVAS